MSNLLRVSRSIIHSSRRSLLTVDKIEKFYPDDPDGYDKEEFDLEPRKNAFYYKYEISKYARQGSTGIKKALELFETMKSKDRLAPTTQSFSPLIYGCAKAGYTKKAFELYEESLRYVNKPTRSVVTCLINACAESPFVDYGLKRLDWFLVHLKVNHNYTMNQIQYRSAIKAYGKLGRMDKAYELMQEMKGNGILPDTLTYMMLLIGCASDKESGCLQALKLFKHLRLHGLSPDTTTYRLLLRCIRDCGMGSKDLIEQTLAELPAIPDEHTMRPRRLASPRRAISDETPITTPAITSFDNNNLPNLLSDNHIAMWSRVQAIQFDKLRNPSDRLMLFGGLHGFLEKMSSDNCKPDGKTFSLLLGCIKPTKHNHLEYFRLSKDYNIQRDSLFYTLLIRSVCGNYYDDERLELAMYFVEQMHLDNLRPNITTFESLSSGTNSWTKARNLIQDVERCGFVISDTMITKMFHCASSRYNFYYLNNLIKLCQERQYRPTKYIVDKLEHTRLNARSLILKKEKGLLKDDEIPVWVNEDSVRGFQIFNEVLDKWLEKVELSEEDHPWNQYEVVNVPKKDGFIKFRQQFNSLERVKREALESGEPLGNLTAKAKIQGQVKYTSTKAQNLNN